MCPPIRCLNQLGREQTIGRKYGGWGGGPDVSPACPTAAHNRGAACRRPESVAVQLGMQAHGSLEREVLPRNSQVAQIRLQFNRQSVEPGTFLPGPRQHVTVL